MCKPLVSVIMNCYNSDRYLRESIDSVYGQTYQNWEIIFWDNCSSDKSAQIAQSYSDKLRYFCGEKMVPLGAARNLALSQAKGEFITFLDCDDLFVPNKIERLLPLFEQDPKVGLVYSNAISFDNSGKYTKTSFSRTKDGLYGNCFRQLLGNYTINLTTVMIRRAVLDSLEYWFCAEYQMIEELDFFLRIAYRWKIDMVEDVLGKWRAHSSNLTTRVPQRTAEEYGLMLQQYKREIPNFELIYKKEIATVRMLADMKRAEYFWQKGSNREARKELEKHLFAEKLAFVSWLMMFFPYKFVKFALSFFHLSFGRNK